MYELAIRVVLGLGDGAGGGEGGGVGGEGEVLINSYRMKHERVARKVMRSYQRPGSVNYTGTGIYIDYDIPVYILGHLWS